LTTQLQRRKNKGQSSKVAKVGEKANYGKNASHACQNSEKTGAGQTGVGAKKCLNPAKRGKEKKNKFAAGTRSVKGGGKDQRGDCGYKIHNKKGRVKNGGKLSDLEERGSSQRKTARVRHTVALKTKDRKPG